MTFFMGIDGGGSTLRVAVVNESLKMVGDYHDNQSVNPVVVGKEVSQQRIQQGIQRALQHAQCDAAAIRAVAIGVAGASSSHATEWLNDILRPVLPTTRIVPSSDFEIALVGAHAERQGVLLLSGTGSVAFGINERGETAQAGGWGYLLGDEGSGYWLGLQALRHLIAVADGRESSSSLAAAVLRTLDLPDARALITWVYHAGQPRTREIAALAPLVLHAAGMNDKVANRIVERGVRELVTLVNTINKRLKLKQPRIAFAGGMLQIFNPLTEKLCARLDLSMLPEALYSPVIGAALLAKLTEKQEKS